MQQLDLWEKYFNIIYLSISLEAKDVWLVHLRPGQKVFFCDPHKRIRFLSKFNTTAIIYSQISLEVNLTRDETWVAKSQARVCDGQQPCNCGHIVDHHRLSRSQEFTRFQYHKPGIATNRPNNISIFLINCRGTVGGWILEFTKRTATCGNHDAIERAHMHWFTERREQGYYV